MRFTILLVIGLVMIVQEKAELTAKLSAGNKLQTVAGYKAPVKIGKRG